MADDKQQPEPGVEVEEEVTEQEDVDPTVVEYPDKDAWRTDRGHLEGI